MRLPELARAKFLERPNRFLGLIEFHGRTERCHVPNPGRMRELLYPGAAVWVARREGLKRKTSFSLVLAEQEGELVSVDSGAPNRITEEAIKAGWISEFQGYRVEKAECPVGDSRVDFLISNGEDRLLLEVKGCTLVEGRTALFPDAPTKRGTRHIRVLESSLGTSRAAILFVVQRGDADSLKPNRGTDPAFAEALRDASYKGVEVIAYTTRVSYGEIVLSRRIPVDLTTIEP